MTADPSPERSLLDALEIGLEPFALCELRGPTRMAMPRDAGATLHHVLEGSGWLATAGSTPLPLAPGALAFVPAGAAHRIASDMRDAPLADGPACRPAALGLAHAVDGGRGGGRLMLLCARVSLGLRGTHGLVDLLRAPLVVAADEDPALGAAVAGILRELADPAPGGRAMLRALVAQCAVALFRRRPEALAFQGLLADPRLARALQAMLDDPGAPHSVETLAAGAAMSRSRFVAAFAAAAGTSPGRFLRDLRLGRAAALLAEGGLSVDRVAARCGFASRSAFSRAFRARYGAPPSQRARRGRA